MYMQYFVVIRFLGGKIWPVNVERSFHCHFNELRFTKKVLHREFSLTLGMSNKLSQNFIEITAKLQVK